MSFLIRPAREDDLQPLYEMAKLTGGGFTNLPPEKPALLAARFAQAGTPFAVETLPFMSPLGVPCHQPPWGEISAVDLDMRKIVWRRPLGTTRDHAPLGMPFPMGVFNIGGSVEVAETPGGGATFRVRLPLAEARP